MAFGDFLGGAGDYYGDVMKDRMANQMDMQRLQANSVFQAQRQMQVLDAKRQMEMDALNPLADEYGVPVEELYGANQAGFGGKMLENLRYQRDLNKFASENPKGYTSLTEKQRYEVRAKYPTLAPEFNRLDDDMYKSMQLAQIRKHQTNMENIANRRLGIAGGHLNLARQKYAEQNSPVSSSSGLLGLGKGTVAPKPSLNQLIMQGLKQ